MKQLLIILKVIVHNPEYKFSDHGSRYRLSTPDNALRKIKTNL